MTLRLYQDTNMTSEQLSEPYERSKNVIPRLITVELEGDSFLCCRKSDELAGKGAGLTKARQYQPTTCSCHRRSSLANYAESSLQIVADVSEIIEIHMRLFCASRSEAEEKRLQWLVVQRSDVRVDFVIRTFKSLGVERITN